MRVRYQADADLNLVILLATIRREPTIDFQTADAAGLAGLLDPRVLEIAASEGRVLVTHDHKTMPLHFSDFLSILLATIRREPTIDFQTADAAGLAGLLDPRVLEIAASEGRVLVTHDHKTMPLHFSDFLSILLATIRREPTIDFQTADAAGLAGLLDPRVLEIAASEGRVLVTHDHKTMPLHFSDFLSEHSSSGVLVVPQHIPPNAAVEELLLIWAATDASEWINRICCLPL